MSRWTTLVCLILISSTTPAWAQFGGPTRVEVETVIRKEVAPTIELVGTLRPHLRSIVAADVDGLVVEMPFDYGATVRKGDPVCILRDVTRRLAVDQARAAAAAIEGELQARQADVRKTAFELERISRLAKLDRSSDKERVDAEADHAAAEARVRQSRAQLDEALALLAVAEDNLARTRIPAPFDGAITSKMTEVGQWVMTGVATVEIVDLNTVRARVMVPESAVAFCTPGEPAMIRVDALGRSFEGAISRVIPEADPQANTFPTDIDIPNPLGVLKAGMFVRAMAPAAPKAMRLLVPKDAVLRRGPSSIAYVVRGSDEKGYTADIAPVNVVAEVMQYLAVESPALKDGDRVVVRGNEGMHGPGPIVIVSGEKKARPTVARDHPRDGEAAGVPAEASAEASASDGRR
ncbi:MAG: efflux RND transporter periplasmic adaptor subunit [Phycisphaerales bacterium]|nr:efflux RND transporter periplasmic adaptor subunit [Phycisphaerales bacterium]